MANWFSMGIWLDRKMQWGKDSLQQTQLRQLRGQHRPKLQPYCTAHTKINCKWITDLNVSSKTIKLSEENIASNLYALGLSSSFLRFDIKRFDMYVTWVYKELNKKEMSQCKNGQEQAFGLAVKTLVGILTTPIWVPGLESQMCSSFQLL